MLLPVTDNSGNALAYPVFIQVERYLKEGNWCYYKSNSEILNIFSGYKDINPYLDNKEVLKVISEKTATGSMIRSTITKVPGGTDVTIKVYGENGEDVYFQEKTNLQTDDPEQISQTIINWLNLYEKTIPYQGLITGVLGNQFTVDFGDEIGTREGDQLVIVRAIKKRKHPLLKEIVDWDTEQIAKAKVFYVTKKQAQANVQTYETNKKLRLKDWVLLKKEQDVLVNKEHRLDVEHVPDFGKMGLLTVHFNVGKASATAESNENKKMGGLLLGVDAEVLFWVTRNYWTSIEVGRHFSSLSKEEGNLQSDSNSFGATKFQLLVGYKYLPMGFFYGPQVDGFMGYTSYNYSLDKQTSDGFGEVKFDGLTLGVRGQVPIYNIFEIKAGFKFMFNPGYTEQTIIYGDADSTSSYNISFGANYLYSQTMTFSFLYEINSVKANFTNPERGYQIKESAFRIGPTFSF
ncbi:MAG: hypothetical protein OHK0056_01620 [Bacteriovoracaceae bacterium]